MLRRFPLLPPGHPQATVCKLIPVVLMGFLCANYGCRCAS